MRAVPRRCRGLAPAARVARKPSSRVAVVNLELGANSFLAIRGSGAGLTWAKGQALTRVDPKTWVWSTEASIHQIEFQLLLNDEVWERGDTHILEPGNSIELTPDFEWPEIPRTSLPEIVSRLDCRSR